MLPDAFFMAFVWAAPPTRDTERPTFTAGLIPALKRLLSKNICPSVIDITLVGMYADTSPECVMFNIESMIDLEDKMPNIMKMNLCANWYGSLSRGQDRKSVV